MTERFADFMRGWGYVSAAGWLTLLNVLVLVLALLFGEALLRLPSRRVSPLAPPLTRTEIVLALVTTALNTLVSWVGWILWMRGYVRFRDDMHPARVFADLAFLVLFMDAAMYLLHRVAHHRWLYGILHRVHHVYDRPRPLTLFALNPAETLSFGALWLVVLVFHDATWLGMALYLTLNTAFGTVGHLGVEHVPRTWEKHPVLRYLASGAFHVGHHLRQGENFGFYTSIWDRLFGTYGDPEREPSEAE